MRVLRSGLFLFILTLAFAGNSVLAIDLVDCEYDHQIRELGMAQPSVDAKFKKMDAAFTQCLAPDQHKDTIVKFRTTQNFVDRKRYDDAEVALQAFFDSADKTIDVANQKLRGLAIDLLKKEDYQGAATQVVKTPSEGNARSSDDSHLGVGVAVSAPGVSVSGVNASRSGQSDSAREYRQYKVSKGDTLWDLSRQQFGHGEYWYELYLVNEDKIEDPRRIYENQKLRIPKTRQRQSN